MLEKNGMKKNKKIKYSHNPNGMFFRIRTAFCTRSINQSMSVYTQDDEFSVWFASRLLTVAQAHS
jgi:hypothetical protein